jgi:DNA-binding MarR family transcriptional regulator
MSNIHPSVEFFLALAKTQTILARRFDNGLGGLGLNEFIILQTLSQAPDERMRRIDLATKVGLTASGITRLLAPMEKVGLVKREATKDDARVSFVALAPGGKRKLAEGMERAEQLAEDLLPNTDPAFQKAMLDCFKDLVHRTHTTL